MDGLDKDQLKKMTSILEKENAAVDIGSYRDAPPGYVGWSIFYSIKKEDPEVR